MVPVAAVADTVQTSAVSVRIAPKALEVPAKVLVPVTVWAVLSLKTFVKVLLPKAIVLFVRVAVLDAVKTLVGVMMADRIVIFYSDTFQEVVGSSHT